MNLETLLEELLRREGGFVNHRHDRGGPTNWGITQRVLEKHLDRPVSIDEVKNLDKELAKEIYLADYYYGPRINTLPEEIQAQVFDMAVNHGPRRAVKMLQEVLNMAGFTADVDGMIGPSTRKMAQSAQEQMGHLLNNALSEYREHFYRQIVANNPSQAVFLKGWLKRAREFRINA